MKHRYAQVVIVSIIHVRLRGTNMQGQAGVVVIMTFAQGTRVSEVRHMRAWRGVTSNYQELQHITNFSLVPRDLSF